MKSAIRSLALLALFSPVVFILAAVVPAREAADAAALPGGPQLVGRFAHGPGTAFVRPFQVVSIYRDLNDPTRYVVSIFDGSTNVQFSESSRSSIIVGQWFSAEEGEAELACEERDQ